MTQQQLNIALKYCTYFFQQDFINLEEHDQIMQIMDAIYVDRIDFARKKILLAKPNVQIKANEILEILGNLI